MKNTIALIISYVHATNTKGSRIRVEAPRMERKAFFSFNHEHRTCVEQIVSILSKEYGLHPIVQAELEKHRHMIGMHFNDWENLVNFFNKQKSIR